MSTSNYAPTDEEREYLAEREAIAEIEGGLSREDVRVLAYKCYVHRFWPGFNRYYPLPRELAEGYSLPEPDLVGSRSRLSSPQNGRSYKLS